MRRLLTLVPLVPLALAGSFLVSPSTAAPLERADEAMTTVTLDVDECPECSFTLIQSKKNGTVGYESESASPDENGLVEFVVPTDKLRGILIAAQAPDNTSGLSQYVVVRFKGLEPGSTVKEKTAQSTYKGSPCWAGTSASAVELDVVVDRRVAENDEQSVTYDMHTSTTQRWWNPLTDTVGGSLEAFDVIPCSRKR